MCTEKNQSSILIRGEEIAFPYFYISAFCSLTDRSTYKINIKYMLKYERNVKGNYFMQKSTCLKWTYGLMVTIIEFLCFRHCI